MGNNDGKLKRKRYVIYSSFIRKYTSSPLVDINNSFEIEYKYQILHLKIGERNEDKAFMKVIFMSNENEEYNKQRSSIEEEWMKHLKLNEDRNIVHYLGREYCNDDKNQKRCEILCQNLPVSVDKTKNASKIQILTWGIEIARALSFAHNLEITHETIIPANIAISSDSACLACFSKYGNAN